MPDTPEDPKPFRPPYGILVGPFLAGVALALFVGYAIGSPPLKVWALMGMGFGAFGSLLVLMRASRRYQRDALADS